MFDAHFVDQINSEAERTSLWSRLVIFYARHKAEQLNAEVRARREQRDIGSTD